MRLVPVDDKLFGRSVTNNILANIEDLSIVRGELGVARGLEGPSRARKTVLGRVDGLAGARGGKVANEETNLTVCRAGGRDGPDAGVRWLAGHRGRHLAGADVHAVQKVSFAKDGQNVILHWDVACGPGTDRLGHQA